MCASREGTTDVTRTVHLGQPSDFEKVSSTFVSSLRESHLILLHSGMFHSCPQRISLVVVLCVSAEHHRRSLGLVRSSCSLGCWTGLPAWNGTRRWLLSQCSWRSSIDRHSDSFGDLSSTRNGSQQRFVIVALLDSIMTRDSRCSVIA